MVSEIFAIPLVTLFGLFNISGWSNDKELEKLVKELTVYQKFIGQYLNYRSPFKDILLYHGLGSGKTVSAINVYNMLYNYTPSWNVFIIIPASLRNDPWLKDLKTWLSKDDSVGRWDNIKFIH